MYFESSLHPRDKSHLTVVCDPFKVLLNFGFLHTVIKNMGFGVRSMWNGIMGICLFSSLNQVAVLFSTPVSLYVKRRDLQCLLGFNDLLHGESSSHTIRAQQRTAVIAQSL